MSKSKVSLIGEDIDIEKIDLGALTTDCHGVEWQGQEGVDVVRAHTMVDIFDHYHDSGKVIKKNLGVRGQG